MKSELVTTLKRQATRILADLRESKDPILITEHGVPSAYLVDVSVFELMQERMRILEGISRGERAIVEHRNALQRKPGGECRSGSPDLDRAGAGRSDCVAEPSPSTTVAAGRIVERVFARVAQLERFPKSGKRPAELLRTPYREVVVPPCRICYRVDEATVFILHVMRPGQLLRRFLLDERRTSE